MKVRKFAIIVAVVLIGFAGPSLADDFPSKPIRILLGASSGGATGVTIRALAPMAEKALGQSVVVESKVGGAGVLALELTKQARPDGYTVGCTPDAPLTGIPHMRKVTYDPQRDFSAIIMFYSQGGVIAVKSDSPFNNFRDLIDYARKNPGRLTMGIAGTGNNVHLGVIQIAKHDKIRFQYVPFQGSGPTTTGLLGGHVMAASCTLAPLIPHVKAGTARLLVILGKERLPQFPDVPTADELGYPPEVTDIVGIKGILTVPKAVPQPIKDRLIAAFSEGTQSAAYLQLAAQNGLMVPNPPLTGAALDRYLLGLSELARGTIAELGLLKK